MRFFQQGFNFFETCLKIKKTMNDTSYSWIEIKVIGMQLSH